MDAQTDEPGLVIFDCDGVLVDSEVISARVLAGQLGALGIPLTAEECIARYTGISMPSVLERIEAEWGPGVLPPDFVDRVRAADADAFRCELRPVAGGREAVEALAVRKCVASSGRLAKIRLTLGLTGLLPLFEPHLFSAEMVARGKPWPDLFLHAADQIGVPAAHCVVIEDSEAGVRAGRAAGMRVLGFTGGAHCSAGHADVLRAAGADRVFTDMVDLPALLTADRVDPR